MTSEFTILDTMIDSDGTIWIKAENYQESFFRKDIYYEIQKYSDSNMTKEIFDSRGKDWYGEGFPTDLEPRDHVRYRYSIYYRQE